MAHCALHPSSMEKIHSDAEPCGKFNENEFTVMGPDPTVLRSNYEKALQAIKNDQLNEFKAAIQEMKRSAVTGTHCLDVCEMVTDVAADTPRPIQYPMTLLAFAGYHARYNMLKFLISEGADVDMGNKESGSPLLQMMMYAIIQPKPKRLQFGVVKFFIDNGAILSRVLHTGGCENAAVLEMCISIQRFDIAEKLIFDYSVDPIYGGNPEVKPIFVEYGQFGTNQFIKMVLKRYEETRKIEAFIKCLLHPGIFSDELRHTVTVVYGRNAVHTFLLSGHEEAIRTLVRVKPDVLDERDNMGKTALHVAAEQGDKESVEILLKHITNVSAEDERSRTPFMLATMNKHEEVLCLLNRQYDEDTRRANYKQLWPWALQNGFAAFFEVMHDTGKLEDILESPLENDRNKNTIAHLAAEGGHVTVFKATFPRTHGTNLFKILKRENAQDRTPLQLAIDKGNIDILMALQERRADRKKQAQAPDFKYNLYRQQTESVEKKTWEEFWYNESPKLLLYACLNGTVEIVQYFVNNHVSPTMRLDKKWDKHRIYTPLACAARAGKHEIVAYLLSISSVSATGFASEKGPDVEQAPDPVPEQYSPLMLASKHGHAKCVTILLEKGADRRVRSERGYNCLMECIKAGHEDVAVTILTHPRMEDEWKSAMAFSAINNGRSITALSMLINEMPEVLEIVFTKCLGVNIDEKHVTYDFKLIEPPLPVNQPPDPAREDAAQLEADHQPDNQADRQPPPPDPAREEAVQLEADHQPDNRNNQADNHLWWLEGITTTATQMEKEDDLPNHPLTLMVKHERKNLLQHPLISCYIAHKWWMLSPAFFLYLFIYGMFLILLTSFSLIIPRPGPEDQYCPSNISEYTHINLMFTDGQCNEPENKYKAAFIVLAVIIIMLSVLFLVVDNVTEYWVSKITQVTPKFLPFLESLVSCWTIQPVMSIPIQWTSKCLAILDSLFPSWAILRPLLRSGMFILTIVFVFGFWNDCWCAPPWQWQIGALALFMAYINFLFVLKGTPLVGVPINMLFNIITTFLELIYLPILLILSFAFPFYMLFVRNSGAVMNEGILEAFSTPARSIVNTLIQSAGVLDFQSIFNDGNSNLVYTPMAYILFFTFVVLMPILFITLLTGLAVGTTKKDTENATFINIKLRTGLAVGTTKKDTENATFINIKLRVNYIVGLEKLYRFPCTKLPDITFKGKSPWVKLRGKDYETQKRLVEDTKKKYISDSVKKKARMERLESRMKDLQNDMSKILANERLRRFAYI